MHKAHGVNLKDTPADMLACLSEGERENLLCYRNQWFHEESWGQIEPAAEILSLPIAILTSSETGSASDDFLMAFQSGKGEGIRIGGSTSGSSGQPLIEDLPGGGQLGVCTIRMPSSKDWRKGIEPHIRVEPTVEDVIHQEDRALSAAMRYLCG